MKRYTRLLTALAVCLLIAGLVRLWQYFGPGPRYLGNISETPVWSRDGKALYYVLAGDSSKIYRYDIISRKREVYRLPYRHGSLIISPDHKEIIDFGRSRKHLIAYEFSSGRRRTILTFKKNTTVHDWLPHNYFVLRQWKTGTGYAGIPYWCDPSTYVMHPDGTKKTIIGGEVRVLAINDNEIVYYKDDRTVVTFYRFNRVSNKRTLVLEKMSGLDGQVSPICVTKRQIIYSAANGGDSAIVESVDLDTHKIRGIGKFSKPEGNIGVSVSPDLRHYYLTKQTSLEGPGALYVAPMPKLEHAEPLL